MKPGGPVGGVRNNTDSLQLGPLPGRGGQHRPLLWAGFDFVVTQEGETVTRLPLFAWTFADQAASGSDCSLWPRSSAARASSKR
jgi:hypothetical protein